MDDKLQNGFQILTKAGQPITIQKHLGEGGQGDVYLVDYLGEQKALKWYKPAGLGKNPQAFYANLEENVERGSFSPEFLWPLAITEWTNGTFGYIMDLIPEDYYSVSDYMLTNVRFRSYQTVIDAALHIVSSFRLLHNAGFSYQDLNDGNFFINPRNGKLLIGDNDNVAPNKREMGILGKPRYMAPEIVVGKNMPDTLSDRFSMAVILFILFCLNHPLEGKRSLAPCLTPSLQEKLYGTEASFIMEPGNQENGPDPKIHRNVLMVWPVLPDYMQAIFLKALGHEALTRPSSRPSELEWVKSLVRFRSEIVSCSCGNQVFTKNARSCTCEACGKSMRIPFGLQLSEYTIPALHDSRLYLCQVSTCNADEALRPVARVVLDEGRLRLKNLSERTWNAKTPSGKSKHVAPKEIVPLMAGIQLTIGEETVTIVDPSAH